jgi:hypothetical protein
MTVNFMDQEHSRVSLLACDADGFLCLIVNTSCEGLHASFHHQALDDERRIILYDDDVVG